MKLYTRKFYFERFANMAINLEYLFMIENISPERINSDSSWTYQISDSESIKLSRESNFKYSLVAIISDNFPCIKRVMDKYGFQSEINDSMVAVKRISVPL